MKVGILGSGDVAKSLAAGFMGHGHVVMLGTRNPSKLEDWDWKNRGGVVGSFTDAARFGEVLVLAVKARRLPTRSPPQGSRTLRERRSSTRPIRSPMRRRRTACSISSRAWRSR